MTQETKRCITIQSKKNNQLKFSTDASDSHSDEENRKKDKEHGSRNGIEHRKEVTVL